MEYVCIYIYIYRYTFYIHISFLLPFVDVVEESYIFTAGASQDLWYIIQMFQSDGLFLKVFRGSNKEIKLQLCSLQLFLSMTSWDLDKSKIVHKVCLVCLIKSQAFLSPGFEVISPKPRTSWELIFITQGITLCSLKNYACYYPSRWWSLEVFLDQNWGSDDSHCWLAHVF